MSTAKAKTKTNTKPPKSPTPQKEKTAGKPPASPTPQKAKVANPAKAPKSPTPPKQSTKPGEQALPADKAKNPSALPKPPSSPQPPKSPVPPTSPPPKNGSKAAPSLPVDPSKQLPGGQPTTGTAKELPPSTKSGGSTAPVNNTLPKDGSKGGNANGVIGNGGTAAKAPETSGKGVTVDPPGGTNDPNKNRALPLTPGQPGVPPGIAPSPKIGSSPTPAKVAELPTPPHPNEALNKGKDSSNRLVSLDALSKPSPNKTHIITPILPPSAVPTKNPLPQQPTEAERFKELNKKGRLMILRAYMSMKTCADESYPSQFSTALCEESHSSGSRYDVAALGGVDSAGILSYDGALAVTLAVNMASRPKKIQINEEQVDYLCTKMKYAYEKGKFGSKVPQDEEFAMNSEIKILCPDLYMMDMVHDILLSHIRCTAQNMEVDPKGMIESIDLSYYDPSEKPQKTKGMVPVKHQ